MLGLILNDRADHKHEKKTYDRRLRINNKNDFVLSDNLCNNFIERTENIER